MSGSLSLKSNLLCSPFVDDPLCEAAELGMLFPCGVAQWRWLRQKREPKVTVQADAPGTGQQ